jgi:hypothetical protein
MRKAGQRQAILWRPPESLRNAAKALYYGVLIQMTSYYFYFMEQA